MRFGAIAGLVGVTTCLSGIGGSQTRPVFRSLTGGVSVTVSVKDGNNPVTGLAAADFLVYDNGVLQTVDDLSIETLPIDLTLFLDTSPSFAGRLEDLKRDIRQIVTFLHPGDRIRLMTFAMEINDAFGWRTATDALDLDTVRIGNISSVYDGIFAAIMHRPGTDRRHLIVAMTDGLDFSSAVGPQVLREISSHVEGVLHLVLMPSVHRPLPRAPFPWVSLFPDAEGERLLSQAAERTGGRTHAPMFRLNIVEAFKQAFDDFRTSYVLRYQPTGVTLLGEHELKVQVPRAPRATIRARRGYFGG